MRQLARNSRVPAQAGVRDRSYKSAPPTWTASRSQRNMTMASGLCAKDIAPAAIVQRTSDMLQNAALGHTRKHIEVLGAESC